MIEILIPEHIVDKHNVVVVDHWLILPANPCGQRDRDPVGVCDEYIIAPISTINEYDVVI